MVPFFTGMLSRERERERENSCVAITYGGTNKTPPFGGGGGGRRRKDGTVQSTRLLKMKITNLGEKGERKKVWPSLRPFLRFRPRLRRRSLISHMLPLPPSFLPFPKLCPSMHNAAYFPSSSSPLRRSGSWLASRGGRGRKGSPFNRCRGKREENQQRGWRRREFCFSHAARRRRFPYLKFSVFRCRLQF